MDRIAIIGFSSAGKSTFLAALWHALSSGEVDSCMRFDAAPSSVEYLDRLVEKWRRREELPRTSTQDEGVLEISITLRRVDRSLKLQIPDLSGEHMHSLVEDRTLPNELAELLSSASGVLLFVSADKPVDNMTIEELNEIAPGPSAEGDVNESIEWAPKHMPLQARLVELLQIIERDIAPQRRIAIVVSAWDLVRQSDDPSPRQWIERELPLFHQYLKNREDSLVVRVFGVSALGQSLSNTTQALLDVEPSDWLLCTDRSSRDDATPSRDIGLPIEWAMRRED